MLCCAVLLQLLPNLIIFHSQFVSSYPEEKLDVTAAREPALKQSSSVATQAGLAAALRGCRLAVAAVFSSQHCYTARHVTANTQRASKFKAWWIRNNLEIIVALAVYSFLQEVIFMIVLFFYCITLNFHFPSFANCIFSLISLAGHMLLNSHTRRWGTFAEEHVSFGVHLDE